MASGGYSSLRCTGFSLWWLLLLRSTGSRRAGFSSCGSRAQQLWRTGLVAPQHVGSSQTRDRIHVPCIGRRILNHCASREVPLLLFYVLVFWPQGMWDLSSPTRDPTHTRCIGRQSLNHWTTREVPWVMGICMSSLSRCCQTVSKVGGVSIHTPPPLPGSA